MPDNNTNRDNARPRPFAELLAALRLPQVEEPLAGTIRARQLQAVVRMTPLALLANLLNVVLVAAAFRDGEQRGFLLAWSGCVVLVMWRAALAWRHSRRQPPRERASPRALRRAVVHAAALGLVWAAMPLALFDHGGAERQLLVATVTTGMICAGGFALAMVPWAATGYVAVLGLGAMAALLSASLGVGPYLAGLLLVYCLIVVGSVWFNAGMFVGRLVAEAEAGRQNEVVGLLLRDFEEHASDVLWETGAEGRLRHVSPKLERLLGHSAQQLAGVPVDRLLRSLTPDDSEGRQHLQALFARVAEGAPFRDVAVAMSREGRTRWWSLTAKPLADAEGRFAGWRGVATDITDSRRAHRQLTWLAHNDSLTGLSNRHRFRTRLATLLARGQQEPLALLCLDLDHFKGVNDQLGHLQGDALLRAVGQRILQAVPGHDIVARLGGDEFAVIFRGPRDPQDVLPLAQRLQEAMREPCEANGTMVAVGTSIGIALAPADGGDVDALLNHADLALFAAKAAGRGRLCFFQPEMAATTRRRLTIEQALRDALDAGQLRLVYQPQVDFDGWRVTGFEALLRWRHPELGELSPTEFVPVAEEAGLMPAIGDWVLREACRAAAQWPGALTVSVNVSPVQVQAPRLAESSLAALRAAGLVPQRLELEITESTFLRDSALTIGVLHGLRREGIRIALDDFGTGYSALGYLRRFPFDKLKIDRSFVRELLARGDARAIVRTIVGLARTLRMQAVAEGVEEPAHASVLERYGCDGLQGYLVSRPLEAGDVAGFLAGWRPEQRPDWDEPEATAAMPLGEAL